MTTEVVTEANNRRQAESKQSYIAEDMPTESQLTKKLPSELREQTIEQQKQEDNRKAVLAAIQEENERVKKGVSASKDGKSSKDQPGQGTDREAQKKKSTDMMREDASKILNKGFPKATPVSSKSPKQASNDNVNKASPRQMNSTDRTDLELDQ